MKGLASKVVLITGAANGIGAEIVRRLVAEQAIVIATDRDAAAVQALASDLGVMAIEHDVCLEQSWAGVAQAVLDRFGRLDGLVNNAGIGGKTADIAASSLDDWQAVFAVNATGTYLGMRMALQVMQAHAGGAIVNIASLGALQGSPGHAAYCASKAAVVSLSRTGAREGSRGAAKVRVNALCPGFVNTLTAREMVAATFGEDGLARAGFEAALPLGPGQPADIAASTAFLLSDYARWITGATYVVDGGMSS